MKTIVRQYRKDGSKFEWNALVQTKLESGIANTRFTVDGTKLRKVN